VFLQTSTRSSAPRWTWLVAALIACAGACVLLYFGRQARPLWVDEEMLGLNARDRSFTALAGALWLGQAAPLGWLALERASMLMLGLSERAVRALPVCLGLLTLVTAVWVGRRWLGPVGAAILALLFSCGDHVWFFALELKQYSADTFGGLLLPSLAAWVVEAPGDQPRRLARRADGWWIVSALLQWFSYGALFVTPACGLVIAVLVWRRAGIRGAVRATALSAFWFACLGLHYYFSMRHASSSAYLREYWMTAFPPVSGGASEKLRWLTGTFVGLAKTPGGTSYASLFWIVAVAGLVISVREQPALGMMNAVVLPSALLLAGARLVPLSGRLSLWIVPSLYLGIATAAETAVIEMRSSLQRRHWLGAAVALAGSVAVAALCADIYRIGEFDITTRPAESTHSLDDRSAVRSLMAQRRPGDAMLTTHLGLPAVWWYGNVNLADSNEGASLQDGGPIFEIWRAAPGPACAPDDLRNALNHVNGATLYLGFEPPPEHFDDLAMDRLAELGAVTAYRRFAESSHTAVIDLRQAPTGRILVPRLQTADPLVRPQGCIAITRAHRW
jgi:hypothetical protein